METPVQKMYRLASEIAFERMEQEQSRCDLCEEQFGPTTERCEVVMKNSALFDTGFAKHYIIHVDGCYKPETMALA